MTSAKSVSSLQSRLLSAKKSTPEDNKPKKVMMRTPDLEALNLRTEDLSFSGLTQLPTEMFIGRFTGPRGVILTENWKSRRLTCVLAYYEVAQHQFY